MKEYHKIDSLFKRDMESPKKPLLVGHYTREEFSYLALNCWEFTEKVDGTNIRVMLGEDGVSFGGKTDNAAIPAPLVKRLQERFLPQAERLAETFPQGVCLYGEGYGPKIQNGGNYRKDQDFVLFDIRVGVWWLNRESMLAIANTLGLDVVPVVGIGDLRDAVALVSAGFTSQWGPFPAEGIVCRPSVELKARNGDRIITKLKHRDFSAV